MVKDTVSEKYAIAYMYVNNSENIFATQVR